MLSELLRNGSGYIDITAYIAIKNCEKGEKKMGFNRGEVYEYETAGGIRDALIVSADSRANDRYINIILLNEDQRGDSCPITMIGGVMYANCNMITLTTSDKILGFIKTVKENEMSAVDAAIMTSLGINIEMKNEEKRDVEKTVAADNKLSVEIMQEAAELRAEAKIYKTLYENLLEKVMK